MFIYHSLDFGPKNQTDVLECCRQSNDALDEDKYFVFLTFYRESSSGAVCPRFCMLMFVLLIGSFIWCFVASACDVELLIVKSASVAVLTAGVRPILVLSNSQSFISLLSMIGVEFRRLEVVYGSSVVARGASSLCNSSTFLPLCYLRAKAMAFVFGVEPFGVLVVLSLWTPEMEHNGSDYCSLVLEDFEWFGGSPVKLLIVMVLLLGLNGQGVAVIQPGSCIVLCGFGGCLAWSGVSFLLAGGPGRITCTCLSVTSLKRVQRDPETQLPQASFPGMPTAEETKQNPTIPGV
ncbi:hypothetical protein F2Q70_00027321 [Brassica cretica]|uniref:Uncharacterized protein n=1 Tax=Brassica cretica TaxID=69181 RepID=A0A8S9LC99_BRACR|nr:hypothetical protein F2Q70_00027321 [Brassica cretica]